MVCTGLGLGTLAPGIVYKKTSGKLTYIKLPFRGDSPTKHDDDVLYVHGGVTIIRYYTIY